MKIKIAELDDSDPAVLYCHYSRQTSPQRACLELDCETGELSATYDAEIGGGVPDPVWHGRRRRYAIPAGVLPGAANELMEKLAPLLQTVLDGYEERWDSRGNRVGRLSDEATGAEEQIRRDLEERSWDGERVEVWDAGEWYRGGEQELVQRLRDGEVTRARLIGEMREETETPDGVPLVLEDVDEFVDMLAEKAAQEGDDR